MNLRKIWLIARREYIFNFRRRMYLFTAFGVPVISIGAMVLVMSVFTQSLEDTSSFKVVGIVDQAGVLADKTGAPTVTLPGLFQLIPSEEQAQARLKDGSLDGYYVIPADFVSTGRIDAYNRANLPLTEGVNGRLDETIKLALGTRLGDTSLAARLKDPLKDVSIYRIGSPQKLDESALIGTFLVPIIFGLLIFMSIITTSQFLMSGMAEEKENRMMELFVTSSRPSEMLWGKLLGLGALGLTQLLVWAAIGLGFATTRGLDLGQALASLQITPELVFLSVTYFILGYLLFGAVMVGIGASVDAEQEGRQIAGILSMFGVLPFLASTFYIMDPNGPIPRILGLFPFTSPVGMVLSISWTNVSTQEVILSLAILVVSVVVVIWLSARIFRLGMLSYGRRLRVRDIIQAFREGRQSIVTASKPRGVAP